MAQTVKNLPAMQETRVRRENPLEKETATHSSILAWRIPWTEEAGDLHEELDTIGRLTLSLFMLERFDVINLPPCGLLVSLIVLCC